MTASAQTSEITLERTIPAAPSEVFAAWLDSKFPGSPWNEHQKLIVDQKVDGLWYWLSAKGTPHYGRFIEIVGPARLQYSWMSPNTAGHETLVTVTFEKKGDGTLLTLVHSGFPNDDWAKMHNKGWTAITEKFVMGIGSGS